MPINKDRDIQVPVVISKELHAKLQEIAEENERTVNKQIAFIVKQYVSNLESKDKQNN